jgi:hypothetical protein
MTKYKFTIFNYLFALTGCCLFLLPLIYAWMIYPFGIESPYTSYSAIGGLLPYSDASSYYSGAQNLLENGKLDTWNSRRPLNAILFAIRLWFTNNNFQTALILQALLCGVSCLLVATCVTKIFGKISGVITFLILFFFATNFIPTTLSETLGLTLGALGFVFLWHGLYHKQYINLGFGALLLTIGLNTRAGAFLILPSLILWMGMAEILSNQSKFLKNKNSIPLFSLSHPAFVVTVGIFAGFIFNNSLLLLYNANNDAALHSNFALTLFGLAAGGKGWSYAYAIYPELTNQTEAATAKFLYNKSLELFLTNPFSLLKGYFKGVFGLLKGLISFFQYKLPASLLLKAVIRLCGVLIVFFGVYRLKRLYPLYQKEIGLIAVGLLSMLLSAGILWTDGGFRVFAATIPFFAAAVGVAFGSFLQDLKINQKSDAYRKTNEIKIANYLSVLLLIITLLGPWLIKMNYPLTHAILNNSHENFTCAANETHLMVKAISGTPHIKLVPPATLFKKSISHSIIENKKQFSRILNPDILDKPTILGLVFDLQSNQLKYILALPKVFSAHGKIVKLCGSPILDAESITQVKAFEVVP